ncbi:WecB/TagA/CpsF family glycosyltransferase [Spirosoma humi]
MKKVSILNIDLINISQQELLYRLKSGVLLTPNVDHLVKLQKEKAFVDIYNKAEWVVCDSKIVFWGLKFLGNPIKEVIAGSSFFPAYCDYHKNSHDVKIFLLGAAPGIADKAMNKINSRLEKNIIVGAHSPSYGFERNHDECEDIVSIINHSNANVLVVGVGAPKQEHWIYKYKHRLVNIDLFMALGATIDFEAGNIKRAPKIFRLLTLEWFYRMVNDPKRLLKRYLIDDIPFFYYLIRQRFGIYKAPFVNPLNDVIEEVVSK